MATMIDSPQYAPLSAGHVDHDSDLGHIWQLTADDFALLDGLSVKRLVLSAGAMRTPHWHANASELTYCVAGTALVSVLDNGSAFSSFVVRAGEMFHIDSGSLHHIENIADTDAEFIIGFRHERPEDFGLGSAFGAMSDAVLGNTYDIAADAFAAVPRDTNQALIARRAGAPEIPSTAYQSDPHRLAIEAQAAPINSRAGSARVARTSTWPVLKDIAMYSVRVSTDGMREPHWHPETAEMGYVQAGQARMTMMNPDGALHTWHLKPGDVYFIPRAYPHHIEVTGADDIHFLIFFDQPTPGDVGYRAAASGYSGKVLAAMLDTRTSDLPALPFTAVDPLIVARVNPLDESAVSETTEQVVEGRS
jgi:oxalate decarboxylase